MAYEDNDNENKGPGTLVAIVLFVVVIVVGAVWLQLRADGLDGTVHTIMEITPALMLVGAPMAFVVAFVAVFLLIKLTVDGAAGAVKEATSPRRERPEAVGHADRLVEARVNRATTTVPLMRVLLILAVLCGLIVGGNFTCNEMIKIDKQYKATHRGMYDN